MTVHETRVTRISELPQPEIDDDACIVCIYGPVIGRKWSLVTEAGLSVGRGEQNEVVLDLDNVSRRHCVFMYEDGQMTVSDLGSTNGTFVNGEDVVGAAPLRNGDHVKIGGAIFKYLTGGNVETLYHEEIYRMTIVDGLTQINNRRYFIEALNREMARFRRFARPLHLIMLDVDHFKHLNDTYGHVAGDIVLRDLAGLIAKNVRPDETFARVGGEEFALIIPELDEEQVLTFAEKIRGLIDRHEFIFDDQRLPVTISLGVASIPEDCESTQTFIEAADTRLYEAKDGGRNRVAV